MKRTIILSKVVVIVVLSIFYNINVIAQGGQKWSTGGNSLSSGDFLGSTNAEALRFYVANVERVRISTQGYLGINTNSPLYPLDVKGRIRAQGWLFADSNLIVRKFLGINTTSPQLPLDVNGDAQISGKLIVGGSLSTNAINAPSGTVSFGQHNITTTGTISINAITANTVTASNNVTTGNIVIDGQANMIYSTNGTLDFKGCNFKNIGLLMVNQIGVNVTNPIAALQINGTDDMNSTIAVTRFSDVDGAPRVALVRFRGTSSNPQPVQNGDCIGKISFHGFDGNLYDTNDLIKGTATENFSASGHGSELLLSTTRNGTVNTLPALLLKNNQTALFYDTVTAPNININKNLYLNSINPTGFTLLGINQYKQVIPVTFSGNSDEVLTGAGTFAELPNASGWKVLNGNIVTTENGNVGIGTDHPVAKLQVEGDAIITGGILTSQVILSDKLQTGKLETDTATSWYSVVQELLSENMQSRTAKIDTMVSKKGSIDSLISRRANVDTMIAKKTVTKTMEAETMTTDTITAQTVAAGTSVSQKVITDTLQTPQIKTDSIIAAKAKAQTVSIGGAVNLANERLAVIGNTGIYGDFNVTGNLKTSGNITFAQNKAILYQPVDASFGNYYFGLKCTQNQPSLPSSPVTLECSLPTLSSNQFLFNGMYSSYDNATHDLSMPLVMLTMGSDGANGIIDVAGTNAGGSAATRLLINYYCGKDVSICTGLNGGNIFLTKVGSASSVGVGTFNPHAKLSVKSDSTLTGLFVETSFDSTSHGYGIVASVGATGDSTIAIAVKKDTTNNFIVYGNGHVLARDVVVKLGHLGDFVFNNDYNLMTIYELENYIKQNHHLPNIPSAKEVNENGMNVGEFQNLVLQKTEEQALYIISLQKQIDDLKKIIEELKK